MSYSTIEKQFTTFVVRTVLGIKCDYHRREQRHRSRESSFPDIEISVEQQNFEIYIELSDLLNSCNLRTCCRLKKLTDKQIYVLIKILNGYTEKEIAASLNITQQGVHAIKQRIKIKLS